MYGAQVRFLRKISTSSSNPPLRVCIVGSGPAGCYTAEKVFFLGFGIHFRNEYAFVTEGVKI